jgi:hypothetical protein
LVTVKDFIRVDYCDNYRFPWAVMYGDEVWSRYRFYRKAQDQVAKLKRLVAAYDARERS